MEVGSRVATDDDLAALSLLATEAVHERIPLRGGDVWARERGRTLPPDEGLRVDLAAGDTHVVVGTIDGTPVGYGVVRAEDLRDGSRLARVSDLFTLEGARGVSVGETMMNALVDWSKAAGCFGIDALALPGDRETKNFFETFGLTARAIVVHRDLEG